MKESKGSEKEKHTSDGENMAPAEEEKPVAQCGVTPFLCGVLPAGKLKATTKPVGCQASGLVQVRPYRSLMSFQLTGKPGMNPLEQ